MEQLLLPRRSFSRRAARFVGRWCVFLTVVYLGVVVVFWFLERTLVFRATSAQDSWKKPATADTQDISLTSSDGTSLHGWWIPPLVPSAGAIVVAHGNNGNVSHRGQFAADLRQATNQGVLLFDYPGYGKSEGRPTEEGCYAAGEAAYAWLIEDKKIPAGRIVLLGESLGGGTAVELATRHEHRALALLYTFTSLPSAAKSRFPFLPAKQLMRTRFDNLGKIGRCNRPVFIAHGPLDDVVPFSQGQELLAAANSPKEFLQMDGFGHHLPKSDIFVTSLARFLEQQAP